MAKLEVVIGADSSELNAEISAAEKKIKDLAKLKVERVKLGLDTKELNSEISTVKKQLSSLNAATATTGKSFSSMTPKVANGGNALMQFSRIAQDAPYGMIGIQNNLTSTAEAFVHLKASTGSTGGALKAVASSIMGAGGILLAISLVTSAMTYMSQNNISVGDLVDKLTGKFDAQKKALSELAIEASKTAGEEISSLKSVISVAQDDTLSREQRLIAVKKLQDMYPAYFGNLTTEKILNGDLTGIINQLSTALKARARASALSAKAGESASKELEIQEKIRDTRKEIFNLLKAKGLSDQLKIRNALEKDNLELTNEQVKALGALDFFKFGSLAREYKDLRGDLASVNKELDHFQALANKDYKIQIALETENPKDVSKSSAGLNLTAVPLPTMIDNEKIKAEGKKVIKLLEESLGSALDVFKNTPIPLDIPLQPEVPTLVLTKMEQDLIDFSNSANQLIQGAIADTFMSLGTMIGNSLAGADGGLEDAGKNILGIMGGFLTQFGQLMITTGVGLVIAKKMLTSGNGIAMIAGGVALVAIGAAFTASSKKAREGASGGLGGGGGSVQGGNSYSSPSSSTGGGGGGGFSGGTVVFEISGQSLIGVLGNALDKNSRLGGSLSLGN